MIFFTCAHIPIFFFFLFFCGNNNKDEDNSPKKLNDKNQQALSQKFRQLISIVISFITEFQILFNI